MATIQELIRASSIALNETRILLAHLCDQHLGWSRTQMLTHDQAELPLALIEDWQLTQARRVAGEPVAYIVGYKDFHAIRLRVNPHVLIPRSDTELLVDLGIKMIRSKKSQGTVSVLDLGTGSGAIALAIAKAFFKNSDFHLSITASDISEDALAIARLNHAENSDLLPVNFVHSDWFSHLEAFGPFDVILSNPPYIEARDPHLTQGDLRFEPISALTDGEDGYAAYRAVLKGIHSYLAPEGIIYFEHGMSQAKTLQQLLLDAEFEGVETFQDIAGLDRVTLGRSYKRSSP